MISTATFDDVPQTRDTDVEESLVDLIRQDEFERKMEASWEVEPEPPDRRRTPPLSSEALKRVRELLRKLDIKRANTEPQIGAEGSAQ